MPSRPAAVLQGGDEFSVTRTGHVRSQVDGNVCRELQFSNDGGKFVGGSLVPCVPEAGPETPAPKRTNRVISIRDAFNGR